VSVRDQNLAINTGRNGPGAQARVFGSVVKHSTPDQGIASSIPLTPTKITEKEICTGSSQEKCSRVSVFYTRYIKEPGLSCVGVLQYLALWATNRN